MELHKLLKVKVRSKKRVGRGLGSGKGKTAGRGTKGQKARGKVPAGFIGGTLPLYKKLPHRRGLGNPKRTLKPVPVPLSKLSSFKANAIVDVQSLIDNRLVSEKSARKFGVKIMSEGDIKTKLTVKVPATAQATQKIEKAGGQVVRG